MLVVQDLEILGPLHVILQLNLQVQSPVVVISNNYEL